MVLSLRVPCKRHLKTDWVSVLHMMFYDYHDDHTSALFTLL
jgi:hypothetical protein